MWDLNLWKARAWKNIYENTEEKRRRRRGEAKGSI